MNQGTNVLTNIVELVVIIAIINCHYKDIKMSTADSLFKPGLLWQLLGNEQTHVYSLPPTLITIK